MKMLALLQHTLGREIISNINRGAQMDNKYVQEVGGSGIAREYLFLFTLFFFVSIIWQR